MKPIAEPRVGDAATEKIRSAALGYLIMRAIPAAAVSSSWCLSVPFGADAGELMAALFLVLGCSVVVIANQLNNARLSESVCFAAAAIYAFSCGISSYAGAADCVVTALCAIISYARGSKKYALHTAVLIAAAVRLMQGREEGVEMLFPLAAAMLCGICITGMTADEKPMSGCMVFGMSAALVMKAFI